MTKKAMNKKIVKTVKRNPAAAIAVAATAAAETAGIVIFGGIKIGKAIKAKIDNKAAEKKRKADEEAAKAAAAAAAQQQPTQPQQPTQQQTQPTQQ